MEILIFFIVIGIIIGIAVYKNISNKKREQQIEEEEQVLTDKGFNIVNKVTDINKQFSLFVDDKNKQLSLYNTKTGIRQMFNYSDIVSFELKEDNNSLISGRAGSAVVGGLLFGGLGAIAGASGSRKVSETSCNFMILHIVVNDMHNPNIEIPIIEKETKKDSEEYETAVEKAQKIVSIMKLILGKNKIEPNRNTTQELREYKQLLDDGIITEEEFNKKKNDILNK